MSLAADVDADPLGGTVVADTAGGDGLDAAGPFTTDDALG
jgi:hypothetical protein